jgi:beta-glucanase (GH16 family)
MKKSRSVLLVIILLSIALTSCMNKENEEVNNSDSDQNETMYQPGVIWDLVWSDEFEDDSIDASNWNLQVEKAGRFNEEWQRYTNSSENAYVENGKLVIKAIHESDEHGMNQYTSARLNTANKQAWSYGKITARIKLPHGEGIWPAFWMLGANIDENGGDTPWPETGEIDILELYGFKDDGVVEANIHYADASGEHAMMGAESFELDDGKFADSFHVFELEWDSEKISWLVDGEQYASTPITADELSEFHQDFFLLLNIAVGGTFAGRPDDTTEFPQYMYVDWVRVYEKSS